MDLKKIDKKINEKTVDSIVSKSTRILKKHWKFVILLIISAFIYKAYTGYIKYTVQSG